MRLVTWNCGGAFRKKFELLFDLNADIFIIQECEDPLIYGGNYRNWAKNYLWIGENKSKGIGVFVQNSHYSLQPINLIADDLKLFLPCRINNKINLIAVWTKVGTNRKYRYIGQFWRYFHLNRREITQNLTIICGDFNSNSQWDKSYAGFCHSEMVQELKESGIYSLYHTHNSEIQGHETIPTFYMYRNLTRPYHIDYIFLSKQLINKKSNIRIGDPLTWIKNSDHIPIQFDVDV